MSADGAKTPAPAKRSGPRTAAHQRSGSRSERSSAAAGPEAESASLEPAPPGTAPAPVSDLHRRTWWWIRAAAIVVTIFVSLQLLGVVRSALAALLSVVLYLLFGAVISFIASPVVELLAGRLGMPRTPAILLALLVLVGVVGGVGLLIAGPIVGEIQQLTRQGPAIINSINQMANTARDQLASHGIQLGGNGVSNVLSTDISSKIAGFLLGAVTSTLSILLDMLVTLVVAFWLLKDGEELRGGLLGLLPGRLRSEADFGLEAIAVVVGGYVRGQLFMAAIVGTMAGVGSLAVGVPFPIVVAIAAGVFELIPLVGPFIGGGVALLLALTKSPLTALFTLILFVGIHIVEGYLLAPRIQARFVRLHPLVTLLALFAGIDAGGFLGAFVAVPTASLLAVYLRAGLGDVRSRHPELFREDRRDRPLERRRRRLLGDFRLFRRKPAPDLPES